MRVVPDERREREEVGHRETKPTEASDPACLVVRFLDRQGAPLARVGLTRVGDVESVAYSGGDGLARLGLTPVRPGAEPTWTFEARCPGYATSRRSARVPAAGPLRLEDWVLPFAGSVEGRVIDPSGAGLGSVQVACASETIPADEWESERRGNLWDLWRPGASTATDADGAFLLEDVPAGRIRLVAVRGDRPAARSEPIEVPLGGTAREVCIRMGELDGGTRIAGRVLDVRGVGVAYAPIQVRGPGTEARQFADADGRFEVRCTDKRPRDLTACDPAGLQREATRLGVRPGTLDLELRLQPAPELEVRVSGPQGTALERFAVAVLSEAHRDALAFFAEAEHPGGVLVIGAPGQGFFVEVRASSCLPARLGPFSPQALPPRIECTLQAAGGVHGFVTAEGRPVRGARVLLHAAAEHDDRYNGLPLRMRVAAEGSTESEKDGAFELSVIRSGRYYLLVEAAGFALAEAGPFELSSSGTSEANLALGQGGTLEIHVRSSQGASVAGTLVATSRGDGRARTEHADEQGWLRLTGLTPGPWQVLPWNEEIDPRQGPLVPGRRAPGLFPSNCRVFEGEVTRVDLWLGEESPKGCGLSGRLTIDDKPADGWRAVLEGTERGTGPVAEHAFVEPGLFRLEVAEPGAYRLRLVPEEDDPEALLVLLDQVELVRGEQHWSLEFRTGALEGTLGAELLGEGALFHRWRRGSLEVFAPLVPDAVGRFRCRRLPAGAGELVRLDPERPMEGQTPILVRALTIEAGETLRIEL